MAEPTPLTRTLLMQDVLDQAIIAGAPAQALLQAAQNWPLDDTTTSRERILQACRQACLDTEEANAASTLVILSQIAGLLPPEEPA